MAKITNHSRNTRTRTHTHTHTTCKHRQTGSSHCSSFVYTLTFSQHLSYVLYTFGKRGPFSNWGPYCSFCYKSPVWMPKQTHTHTHTHTHIPIIIPLSMIDILPYDFASKWEESGQKKKKKKKPKGIVIFCIIWWSRKMLPTAKWDAGCYYTSRYHLGKWIDFYCWLEL